ncbi:hypothetical protein SLEP1_g26146 [Rubroshorea leprosula]|nr:hypothetical protein SLEP1_g26146 [Rubroshorea leprosula]
MDEDSDVDDDPNDDSPVVLLSKEEKQRIRAPWMNALIVEEDLHRLIFGGPWFVGPYFMTLRRWEPHFVPSEALQSFTTIAVWAQLPNLSADYYDPSTLQKIGNKVGNLLRVDAHTAHHTRGQYVRIGRHRQKVLYEGVNALCFSCGRIGHPNSQCTKKCSSPAGVNAFTPPLTQSDNHIAKEGQLFRSEPSSTSLESPSTSDLQQECANSDKRLIEQDEFCPWLLVERRRSRRRSNQTQVQSEKSPPARNEIRGSGLNIRRSETKQQSGPTASSPNGSNGGSLNADKIGTGSPSMVAKSLPVNSNYEHKANLKNQTRGGGVGLQYVRKGTTNRWNAKSGSNSKVSIQSNLMNKGPSAPLNCSSNVPVVDKPTCINDPYEESMCLVNKAHLPSSNISTGLMTEAPPSSVSHSPLAPLLPPPTPPTSADLTHGTSIPPAGPQPRGFLDIQWKLPPTGVSVEPDSSNPTTVSVLLERLSNNPSLETTNSSSQGPKPPSGTTVSSTTTHSSCKELGSLLRVGSNLQRKRRTNRKDGHPYQAPAVNLPNNVETLLLYPTQGTNEASPSSSSTQPTTSRDLGNGVQVVPDSIPFSGCTDGHVTGAASESFKRHVMDLKATHNPYMMLIIETKVAGDRAKAIASHIYPNYHVVDADGFAGGLWLLWDASQISIDILADSDQAIHAVVKVCSQSSLASINWIFSGVYGRPQFELRSKLWQELRTLSPYFKGPWVIAGDFNEVVDQSEKFGGAPINQHRVQAFTSCMNDCQMLDLGFTGGRFTWANMQSDGHIIRERLDRVWGNADWKLYFPEASVFHLPRVHSDHNPLLLDLEPFKPSFGKRPFRLEKFWMDHPEFQNLVQDCWGIEDNNTSQCLETMMKKAKLWSRTTFGSLFKRKKQILARLEGIHRFLSTKHCSFLTSLEKDLVNEYSKILKLEEDLWFMKSRTNWILDGDRNSRFFHVTTLKHRSHNKILGLKDAVGVWTYEPSEISNICRSYFLDLFSSSLMHSFSNSYQLANLTPNHHPIDSHHLADLPTEVEIRLAISSFKPFKAPGPDGVHPFFYQRFWQDIRSKLCSDIIGAFSSGAIPMGWNNCLISFIPKGKAPSSITQFRPIGLCNTSYKVISKILVNRLRPILDSLISPCQASFIPGRRGSDNVIILQELVYSFSKKTGKVGDLIFKIDLEKAYDCLEWSFIRETLLFFQFPPKIIDLIMSAICTSSVSVLLNGDRTEPFSPSRGIRQGDPLSPYIFIPCMEFLALTITKASSLGYWKGCKAGRGGPLLSHLFFADDLLFIGKATKNNCLFLKSVLEFFSSRSGLKINPLKSYVFFSKNTPLTVREEICSVMGFLQKDSLGKYLGIPISSKRPCKQDYVFILDKVRAKLEGWKVRFFSLAGRITLINFVMASIPLFYMQSTMLPASILSELDKISRDFLWGSNPDHRKLHLISWDKVSVPKSLGGLGIKSAKETNLAAMAKLNWRFFSEKDKLWNSVLIRKYNINSHPSILPTYSSPVMRNLKKDCWLFNTPLNSILVGPLSRSDEDLRVADVFSCVDFNSSLISYPLPDTILETIKANPISKIGLGNDSYSWKRSCDGSFSMKVAYLMAKGVNPNPVMNWNWIWKIHTLPKIQCFIWLLCYERLKTLDLLSRLGIVESNVCPMCLVAKETCDHLCRECPSSSFIWHTFFPQGTVGPSNSLFQWIKDNCLSKNMCPTIPIPWGTVFSFILWSNWLQRNNKLYSSDVFEPNYIISIIRDKVYEFYSASPLPSPKNTQKESRLVCWEKPPEGYCKLNTDGSAHGNPGPASAGGVIRDHLGRWIVGFACKIGYASCLRAEL